MTEQKSVQDIGLPEFSLVLGGPLYQLFRRAHLTGDHLEHLKRRLLLLPLLAWLPLLVLSALEGNAWGPRVQVPFLFDLDVHTRFLLALPLFIAAELVVHQRMRVMVSQFVDRGLVPSGELEKFKAAISSAFRLRNSVLAEVLLVAIVYGVGVLFIWRSYAALDVANWSGTTVTGQMHPTLAGWWYGLLSLPLIQFLLLRWYYRLFIWSRFLFQVSRLKLELVPTHPDGAGGLGFLGGVGQTFALLMIAQGALLAGVLANRIFIHGARLTDFKLEIIGWVALILCFVLGPLCLLLPTLADCKRVGLREYGALAQRYVREFDQKWLRGGAPSDEPLLGSADIQSLNDLSASYQNVREMKLVPVSRDALIQVVLIALLPISPLVLTMIPFSELLERLLAVVF